MKVVTLDSIEWIESPNFFEGRSQTPNTIVGHWWGDPATNPTMNGVIAHFQNSAVEVSAHFVVSGDRVVQMVNMNDTAWHARQANPYTIGIEIDPNTPGNTYETVGALVKFIRGYYGDIPLKKHSDFVSTACPGTIDLGRIDSIARGTFTPLPTPAPKPIYRVFKAGSQLGAYTVELNAYTVFKAQGADTVTLDGRDVTKELVLKYDPPVTVSEKDKQQDAAIADTNAKLNALQTVVDAIVQFLSGLFTTFKK